jgi:hypothetical protein
MRAAAKRKHAKPAAKTRTKPKPKRKPEMTDKDEKPAAKFEPTPAPKPAAPVVASTGSLPPEALMTEQEKDTSSDTPGVGPVGPSQTSPGPVETIEDLGIGPREPYPTGAPPAPVEPPVAPTTATKKGPGK